MYLVSFVQFLKLDASVVPCVQIKIDVIIIIFFFGKKVGVSHNLDPSSSSSIKQFDIFFLLNYNSPKIEYACKD